MADREFERTLTDFLPKMRIRAQGLTRNKAAAEDLVQDVVIKALNARECFIAGTNFSAWIHRIMFNHFISGVRSSRRLTDLDQMPELSVAANQQSREELRAISVAYQRLPPDQREALRIIVLEEGSYEEASEAIGCAVGTLKSRVHRARLQLRAHMDGQPSRLAA
jgi:RNA polymerase sigma-70 factor (ECF subfamily)